MATAISGVNGWLVVGPGIVPGTLVSSSTGSTSFVLNQFANNTTPPATATQPATYYFVDLPSPAGTYAAPCIIFNRTNGRSYLNMNGYWVDQGDAGTFVGGIFEGGAGFFGSLSVAQLSAGTANFAGTVTFQSGGSGPYVEINSSGVAIAQSSSGPNVQITSTDVIIANGSGATVDISASDVTVTNGDFVTSGAGYTITLSPGGINGISVVGSGTSAFLGVSQLKITNLPSSSPGSGSRSFWYDPSDSNRVKFAP
jgi:hypothetical protein